jgi:hypothetical protein
MTQLCQDARSDRPYLGTGMVSLDRTYDLRLPRRAQQGPGLIFTDSPRNWVAKRGSLNALMVAMLPRSPQRTRRLEHPGDGPRRRP